MSLRRIAAAPVENPPALEQLPNPEGTIPAIWIDDTDGSLYIGGVLFGRITGSLVVHGPGGPDVAGGPSLADFRVDVGADSAIATFGAADQGGKTLKIYQLQGNLPGRFIIEITDANGDPIDPSEYDSVITGFAQYSGNAFTNDFGGVQLRGKTGVVINAGDPGSVLTIRADAWDIFNNNDTALATLAIAAAGLTINAASKPFNFAGSKFNFNLAGVAVFANNAAAITGGLLAGDLYRTGANPDVVCIVH